MVHTPTNIRIRGVRDGLLVTLGEGQFEHLCYELESELQQKNHFFRGSRIILETGHRQLALSKLRSLAQLIENQGLSLWAVLTHDTTTKNAARDLGLATRLPGSNTDLDGNQLSPSPTTTTASPDPPPDTPLFRQETLRSGRSIYHEGSVTIIGDVNPGAEIIAGGHIVVWGRLRGVVHAGAFGDETAVVCALELLPPQIRIADQIAIAPPPPEQPQPEIAFIRGNQIVVEGWSQHRSNRTRRDQ
ncbi:MAG TPA: septum site-determining protein MinC [Anaerolineae bacterium]|nr:septum site-determining protein MinC [Anaerolineae bacterium]